MKIQNMNAMNFSYLLLEYYKSLNLGELEVVVILMIDHLLTNENDFVTTDILLLKMKLDSRAIDEIMANLVVKKYVEININKGKATISIRPLQKILCKMFEKSIFSDEEMKENEEKEKLREELYTRLENGFNRQLSPIEINRVDERIKSDIDEDIIYNSIKDALSQGKYSINYIDRIIVSKIKKEDKFGNKIK